MNNPDLGRDDISVLLALINECLTCRSMDALSSAIADFARSVGFEYAFCAHLSGHPDEGTPPLMLNVSNPPGWIREYVESGYIEADPVRHGIMAALMQGHESGVIEWVDEQDSLSDIQLQMLERRRSWGLENGFSAFCWSPRHQTGLAMSMASRETVPTRPAMDLAIQAVAHISRAMKRLDLQSRVLALTGREAEVAAWMAQGKTNWEIAQILEIGEGTVKFHVTNILERLGARNRQNAVSILIAERYLA